MSDELRANEYYIVVIILIHLMTPFEMNVKLPHV